MELQSHTEQDSKVVLLALAFQPSWKEFQREAAKQHSCSHWLDEIQQF